MKIYDRLYKEMKFPPIIMELLNCPGLLRLRDVRMANNQFVAFPAFANSSRYEHSLGVCYLAGICAKNLGLSEKDTIELMMACLYHDVGTPPFAHAMEEVLQVKFSFDHEQNLKNLIIGTTGNFDGEFAQIYQGQRLKILSVCQSKEARRLGVNLHRIAKLAAGDSEEFLSDLVNSKGMDLDNIDNIFRASSAMGILTEECGELAKMLANSFMIKGEGAYSRLKFESGAHRVQRVPKTEASGRIHTSTATVLVMPELDEIDFEIKPEDLHIDVYRSGGAGGQHVNKTESAVRITHLPTKIVVSCQDGRSQHENKEQAMRVLRAKVAEELRSKQMEEVGAERKLKLGRGERSEKIRTYNYPQNRVTDHRIGFTLQKLDRIIEGDLDEIIEALINEEQKEKLEAEI